MFLNSVKYQLIRVLRTKEVIIWMILFPVVLGILYKFTFGSLLGAHTFKPAKTAVVEHAKDNMFHSIMDAMAEGDKAIVDLTYCDEDKAIEMLQNGDVKGVIVIDGKEDPEKTDPVVSDEMSSDIMGSMRKYLDTGEITSFGNSGVDSFMESFLKETDAAYLEKFVDGYSGGSFIPDTSLSLKLKSNGIEQSMIKKMAEMYMNLQETAKDMMNNGFSNESGATAGDSISKAMEGKTEVVEEISLTEGNTDPYATYMYNLIAMVAIFGSLSGLSIAQNHQANLSTHAMRRECSGMPKFPAILSSLIAYFISQIFCVSVSVTFITFVLQTDFGSRLPYVYLGGMLGAIMGVSMGFFFGAIGRWNYDVKAGIVMALNMSLCFMSGAMLPGMKAFFQYNLPVINALNPAAILCDSFYYLSVDPDLHRYLQKMVFVLVYSAVFILLGFLLTRNRKYNSL